LALCVIGAIMSVVQTATALAEQASPIAPQSDPGSAASLVEDLRSRIVHSDSATAVLERWCGEHGLAARPQLVALRQTGEDKPLTDEQRARLGVGPDETVRYRHVRLACGDHVLSEADNWYVPSRLTPDMNAALDGSDAPFGRVVRPLAPVRRVVAVQSLPLPAGPVANTPLLRVDALLLTGAGMPFCEVVETYLGAALPGQRP
jgi:chorismate-pyruvate lyase